MLFISETHGNSLAFNDVAMKIEETILKNPDNEFRISIGVDSQNSHKTRVVTAICVWKVGNGASVFYSIQDIPVIKNLHDRLIYEASKGIEVANGLFEALEDRYFESGFDYLDHNVKFEIHCDVSTSDGKSNNYIKEIVGYIKGTINDNYEVKCKPEAYAASSVADKKCR